MQQTGALALGEGKKHLSSPPYAEWCTTLPEYCELINKGNIRQ
jgi:hypothetical protein